MDVVFTLRPDEITSGVVAEDLSGLYGARRHEEFLRSAQRALVDDEFQMRWTFSCTAASLRTIAEKAKNVLEILDRTDATATGSEDIEDTITALLDLGLVLHTLRNRVRESEQEVQENCE
jgi:hypothetical protein